MSETNEGPSADEGWIKAHVSQDKEATLDKIKAHFQRSMNTWKASGCRTKLRQILDKKMPEGGWKISQAICLGSGSFSRDSVDNRNRSMFQWVLFVDTVEHIQSTSDVPIKKIAQEMAYSELDKEFLRNQDVTVFVPPNYQPSSWFQLDRGQMFFEPFIEMDVACAEKLMEFDPKLYIGASIIDRLESNFRNIHRLHPNSAAELPVEEFVSKHAAMMKKKIDDMWQMLYFPTFEEGWDALAGLQIYTKQPADEDNEG